jgi:protein-tyrosine phosphatase
MAEHILRRYLADDGLDGAVGVASCGLRVRDPGGPADPRAVAVLRAAGYSSDHRGRQCDPGLLARCDMIIALDSGHERLLRQHAPDSAAKLSLLRAFDPAAGGALDVPDPVGGDARDYERVLSLIEAAAPGILAEVRSRLGRR